MAYLRLVTYQILAIWQLAVHTERLLLLRGQFLLFGEFKKQITA